MSTSPSSGWSGTTCVGRVRLVRGPRLRRRVGLRPLRPHVRRGSRQLLRGDDDARGAGVGHLPDPARPAGHRRHLPPPVGAGRAGGHRRPRQPRPARAGAGRGVVRGRAPSAGHRLPAAGRAVRPARGLPGDRHAGCSPARSSTTRAASSAWPARSFDRPRSSSRARRCGSAGPGRRRTLPLVARFADVWHCYESPQSYRELSAVVDELADRGRPGPGLDHPGVLAVAVRALGRGARQRRGHACGGRRLPRLRVARRGRGQGRGVRRPRCCPTSPADPAARLPRCQVPLRSWAAYLSHGRWMSTG